MFLKWIFTNVWNVSVRKVRYWQESKCPTAGEQLKQIMVSWKDMVLFRHLKGYLCRILTIERCLQIIVKWGTNRIENCITICSQLCLRKNNQKDLPASERGHWIGIVYFLFYTFLYFQNVERWTCSSFLWSQWSVNIILKTVKSLCCGEYNASKTLSSSNNGENKNPLSNLNIWQKVILLRSDEIGHIHSGMAIYRKWFF